MTLALAHRLGQMLPPALAHRAALKVTAMGWPVVRRQFPAMPVTIAGVTFPNPLGLAAGFDKNGVALPGLSKLGFGHVEIGTVTPRAQTGNPGSALFRLGADRALINRLGMPNDGAEAVAARIAKWREANPDSALRIGISVGSNRDSTDIATDVAAGVRRLAPLADYAVVNLSSPNTTGLRDWQTGDRLVGVLDAAAETRARLPVKPPMFLKIAPDLEAEDETTLVDRVMAAGLEGLVVCNTSVARAASLRSRDAAQTGGLSGAPLTDRALAQLRRVRAHAGDRLALIASGGMMTAADSAERRAAGAALVQVMTGWVYRGPRLVGECLAAMAGSAATPAVSAAQPPPLGPPRPGRVMT